MNLTSPWKALAVLLSCWSLSTEAQVLLRERAINLDGKVSDDPNGPALPALGGTFSGVIDSGTGLGTMILSVSGLGPHSISAFLDHDIDVTVNSSFNEKGLSSGSPAAGQTWELGDPSTSTILSDFALGGLTDSNLLKGARIRGGDDVSMAMGWNFTLGPDDIASILWTTSTEQPASGFYLEQTDPDSAKSIFFTSTLTIQHPKSKTPDAASTLQLLAGGFLLLGACRCRTKLTQSKT